MRIKHLLAVSGLLVCAAAGAATQVSVIVEGQIKPGVYGRVEVGNPSAPPPVWRPQPVIIAPQPQVVAAVPVYVHVPPGHARNWRRHCHRYNACGHPVYFVKSAEYEPGYLKKKHHHHHHGRKHGRDHD